MNVKLVSETMKTFYSFKLKQNGSGLLLSHIVHEIEAMHSSRFFMLIVPILKWSIQSPLICISCLTLSLFLTKIKVH